LVLVPARLAQRGRDELPLGVGKGGDGVRQLGERGRRRLIAHRRRQVVERDDVGSGEREGALDGVLELANVARPCVRAQRCQRLGRDPLGRHLVLLRVAGEEVVDERREVVTPGPQRGGGAGGGRAGGGG